MKVFQYTAVFVLGMISYPFLVVPFIISFLPESILIWWLQICAKWYEFLGF